MSDVLIKFLGGFLGVFILFCLILGPERAGDLFGGLIANLVRGIGRLLAHIGIFTFQRTKTKFASGATRVAGPKARNQPLPAKGDVHDYRGLATEAETAFLRKGVLPLGQYAYPNGNTRQRMSISLEALTQGCLVVGPTGTGKTENVIAPWIEALLASGASVVTVDVKGDMLRRFRDVPARIWHWSASDRNSQSWNWMRGLEDERDVEAAVRSILGVRNPSDAQPFFYERDYRWLRALIQVVLVREGEAATPASLSRYLSNRENLDNALESSAKARLYADDLADLIRMSGDEAARAVSGLLNALHLFATGDVKRITGSSDFDPAHLGDSPTLLIIGASLADARRSEVLSSILISRCLNVVYRRFDQGTALGQVPIYFVIDEAARLRERIPFDEALSVVRSASAGFCLAVQDLVQFGDEDARTSILANCNTLVLMRGCSPQTAEAFGARLGERQSNVITRTHNRQSGQLLANQHSHSVSTAATQVLASREIMSPPSACGRFCAFVHVRNVCANPILVKFPPQTKAHPGPKRSL